MKNRMLVAAALVAVAALGFACGDTSEADPTPVQTWKITPASGGAATAVPTVAEPAATEPAGSGDPGATTLALAGVSSTFDVEELEATAGTVTVEFDNQDAGVVHNVHFFAGDSAQGEDAGETDIEVGPVVQMLTMELEPGEYFYQCDAHPTTMKGTLTVS